MLLHAAHERLLNVQLECLPYQKILKKYDRPFTFFYLDPPYFGLPYYNFNFTERDYSELASLLRNIKGKFLLSLNDRSEVRKIFTGFEIQGLVLAYSSQRKAGKIYKEVLISNYALPSGISPVEGRPLP